MSLCNCAYAHPVHTYPVAARGKWGWASWLSSRPNRQQTQNKQQVKPPMLRRDNLPAGNDAANSSSHTEIDEANPSLRKEIDVLNEKILSLYELFGENDKANSSLENQIDDLEDKISNQNVVLLKYHEMFLNLHTKIDELEKKNIVFR